MVMKSSINWRRNNRASIFWGSFSLIFIFTSILFLYNENTNERIDILGGAESKNNEIISRLFNNYIIWPINNLISKRNPAMDETETFVKYSEPVGEEDEVTGSLQESISSSIQLVELDSKAIESNSLIMQD